VIIIIVDGNCKINVNIKQNCKLVKRKNEIDHKF